MKVLMHIIVPRYIGNNLGKLVYSQAILCWAAEHELNVTCVNSLYTKSDNIKTTAWNRIEIYEVDEKDATLFAIKWNASPHHEDAN